MPFLKVKDANIYYEVHGEGPPLLLVAGMASDSKSWQFILEEMKPHHTLILFDNRGCGRTSYPGSFTLSTIADDAIALLDLMEYDRVDVLGHSMGGMIVVELALKHPDRIKRLMLASSSPQLSPKAKATLDELSVKWANGIDMADWFRIMFRNLFTKKSLKNKKFMDAAIIFALAYPYPQTQQGFNDQVEAISGFDRRKEIKDIKHEALILSGQEDILIPPKESRALCNMGRKNDFVVIAGAAHSIHAEQPLAFSRALRNFLAHDE